jgi:hypothetical protein
MIFLIARKEYIQVAAHLLTQKKFRFLPGSRKK